MEQNENKNQRNNNIPNNDPSKAMDSKKEVENSNDNKIDQDFPGYPHYPAKEDIMDKRTDNHKVDMDVENIPNNKNTTDVSERFMADGDKKKMKEAMIPGPATDDDLDIKEGTDGDLTNDDITILNSTDAEIGTPQNVDEEDLNTDLDIPGAELDDANEAIGEEDEENNYYSLGGDNHENLEEDPSENW